MSIVPFFDADSDIKFSNSDRDICDPGSSKNPPIAIDFGWRPHGLLIVVRKFDRGAPVNLAQLANQAYRIEAVVAMRIAISEIIGEIRSPARAETDLVLRRPFARVQEVLSAVKISWRGTVAYCTAKISVQSKDGIDIESGRMQSSAWCVDRGHAGVTMQCIHRRPEKGLCCRCAVRSNLPPSPAHFRETGWCRTYRAA